MQAALKVRKSPLLNRISDQVAEAGTYIKKKGTELLSTLKEGIDGITGGASSVLDSASETSTEALDWIRRKWDGPALTAGTTPSQEDIVRLAQGIAPVVWLLGKTGAGKSSIVAALTGASHAEVGSGFRPCTLKTHFYDLPEQMPLVRFLDTRGLEEPGYDPTEDIQFCQSQAHLIIAVIKAADASQDGVLATLEKIRKSQPDWPIIVVQTGLHDVYRKGADHPETYAFDADGLALPDANVPRQLVTLLNYQRNLFKKLKGSKLHFVPVDFTPADEGFQQTEYGKKALVAAILVAAPESIKRMMRTKIKQEKSGASDEEIRVAYSALLAAALASAKRGDKL